MTKDARQILRSVRPKFRTVAPLQAAILQVFGYGNIVLGLAFISDLSQLQHLLIINEVISYQLWGFVFLTLGLVMMTAYYANSWKIMRQSLFVGLIIKTFWQFALISRYFSGQQDNTIVPIIWAIIFSIQVAEYIYFLPPTEGTGK